MNNKSHNRRLVLWPLAAVAIGALISVNPFYAPRIPLGHGFLAWAVDLVLVLLLSANRIMARIGLLMTGFFMAIPCFVWAPPLFRAWLMCCMCLPWVLAAVPVLAPSRMGFRAELAFFCSWLGTREVKRQPHHFDTVSLLQMITATAILAVAITGVIKIPALGYWFLLRWLAGGIMILAFAELATACHNFLTALAGITMPSLMRSPAFSASMDEFWTRRWNPGASLLFHIVCFKPLARFSTTLALFAAFALSGIGHALLAYMAIGQWGISWICGAFFFVQPFFIVAERWLKVRRWRPAARHAWTLAVLAVTCPLFVEPMLQVTEQSWGEPNTAFWPTMVLLLCAIIINGFFLVLTLISCSGSNNRKPALA